MRAWEEFLKQQESELGLETVQKWLSNLKVVRFDACNLYLEAQNSFQLLWFKEHIQKKAQSTLLNGNRKPIKVHISLVNASPFSPPTPPKKLRKPETTPFKLIFNELNTHCTFENYVVSSDSNLLAYEILKVVSGQSQEKKTLPSGGYNPIYIHGESGSGKTHLLMSAAQIYRSKGLKTIFARAETFTDHVVSAIRAGEMSAFRQSYRNIDVLIIDDIDVFARKGATQEEFFHTFNTLHLEGKQIFLSANCAPQQLQFIEPRLISRFEWGLVLSLVPVNQEGMRELLNKKASALNFTLPNKIIEYLLETFLSPKNLVRALEALILRLHLDSQHSIGSLSLARIKELLADLELDEQKSALTPRKIVHVIAEQYGIRVEDILGKCQTRECSLPRQLAMHICRHLLKLPFMKIGDIFSRDHSTVITGIKQIQKALDQDNRDIAGTYHFLLKKLSEIGS